MKTEVCKEQQHRGPRVETGLVRQKTPKTMSIKSDFSSRKDSAVVFVGTT